MSRQAFSDGSGHWFNPETSTRFDEDTWWNGNNHISKATGSQWEHEELFRTKGGRWVKHSWSQWQGSADHWVEITNQEAAQWLATNGHEPHESCEKEFQALEVA